MLTATTDIRELFEAQRAFFKKGHTRAASARRHQLKTLREAIKAYEDRILAALYEDLRKPKTEAYIAELAVTYQEIDETLKYFEDWMEPKRVRIPLLLSPATGTRHPEPYGVAGIISPWNYPFQLLIIPAIGAIAAGNTVLLKPSELAPATSSVIAAMIAEYFDPQWVAAIEGSVPEAQELLAQPLDYIFFTGGTEVGKIVMRAAAEHLTPVTLELGGKSPTIIDRNTNLEVSVKRIIGGKFLNAGQTCVAPDYVLVPSDKMEEVLRLMEKYVGEMYGRNPQQSQDFARIVNNRHFQRISSLMGEDVRVGGEVAEEDLYIAPTIVVVDEPETHPAMQQEIFGPILPLVPYETLDEAIAFINERPKPLALYLFSNSSRSQRRITQETSSGNLVINDAVVHFALSDLPIGGVGASGMGAYHGRHTFDTFSHEKGVLKRNFLIDPPQRYAPYKTPLDIIRGAFKWLG